MGIIINVSSNSPWISSMMAQERQYKLDHPDYKEQARQHAKEEAQKARDAANNQ